MSVNHSVIFPACLQAVSFSFFLRLWQPLDLSSFHVSIRFTFFDSNQHQDPSSTSGTAPNCQTYLPNCTLEITNKCYCVPSIMFYLLFAWFFPLVKYLMNHWPEFNETFWINVLNVCLRLKTARSSGFYIEVFVHCILTKCNNCKRFNQTTLCVSWGVSAQRVNVWRVNVLWGKCPGE